MLRRVVAADGTINECTGKSVGVKDVKEVCNVEWRGGQAVENADCPALLRKAPVPGPDGTLRIWVHMRVAAMPEEPNVQFI